jgi:hypothetical protein
MQAGEIPKSGNPEHELGKNTSAKCLIWQGFGYLTANTPLVVLP